MHLIFDNIRRFAREHTAIFTVFMLCECLSVIAILFVFHYHTARNTEDEQYDTAPRQFTIQRDMTKQEADAYVERILREKGREVRSVSILLADHPVRAQYLYFSLNGRFIQVGSYFEPEDFAAEEPETTVVIGERFQPPHLKVGDTYLLGDRPYIVRGIASLGELDEVLPSTLPADERVSSLVVELKNIPGMTRIDKWRAYLSGLAPDAAVSAPPLVDISLLADRIFELLSTSCILLLSFFSLSSLYVYILDRRSAVFAIWRIVGCTRRRGTALLAGEVFALITIPFWVCAAVYHWAISGCIQRTNVLINTPLLFRHYAQAYLLVLAACAVVFIPRILRFARRPVWIYRQEG